MQDKDGDENYNVYAVDPGAPAAAGQEAPAARNITDAKGVRAFIYATPKADPDVIYVGLNDRDPAWHDLYQVRISTGERTLIRQNTERIAGWNFDLAGKLRLAERVTDTGDTEVLRVDPSGFTKVYSCTVFESCGVTRFHKDGKRVYLETNKGDADLSRLVLFDPGDGQGRGRGVRSAGQGGLRQRDLLRGHRRAGRHVLRGRAHAPLLPRQGATRRTTSCSSRSCPAATSPSARRPRTTSSGS